MSSRYLSDRFPSSMRAQHSATSYHERNHSIRSLRSSPYFRHDPQLSSRLDQPHITDLETNWYPDDNSYSLSKYSRERWHDNDNRIRERSFSPIGRRHSPLRRSEEGDLRDYLISSRKYDRRLSSDFGREGSNRDRTFSTYQMASQTTDRRYDLRLNINSRTEQKSLGLWSRALPSERDCRDDKYSHDLERNKHFSDLMGTSYDSCRGRGPDYRDRYSSESRREEHVDYRDEVRPTDYRREDHPYNNRKETYLPDSRRDWPSPDRRCQESTDSSKWRYYNQHRRELTPPGYWQNTDERRLNQSYLSDCQRDSRYFHQRHLDSLAKHINDLYPDKGYESYERAKGRVPISDGLARNDLNHHEGRGLDYLIGEERYEGHPHWNQNESAFNKAIFEPNNPGLTSLPAINNSIPHSEIQNNPFAPVVSKPAVTEEPLPRLSILVQYLFKPSQTLSDFHIQHVKSMLVKLWEEQKKRKEPKDNWQPTFLEFIPRQNGLAIVCGSRRSFVWLRNRPIPGLKGVLFAVCDAAAPVKKVKLCFQIPNCTDDPHKVLLKLQKDNRRSAIKFNLFRVLNSKYHNGSLSMVVQSDSWTALRLKRKLNWRPRYGNRRIRINLMGKKKPSKGEPKKVKSELQNDLKEYDEMDEFSESYDEL